jgi:hypothetical protein
LVVERDQPQIRTAGGGKGYNLMSTLLLVESKGIHPHVYNVDQGKRYTLTSIPAGLGEGYTITSTLTIMSTLFTVDSGTENILTSILLVAEK